MSSSRQCGGFRNNFRQNKRNKTPQTEVCDESNPVISSFKEYAAELDDKHDRYEKIVKISRDITIESKRIIFLLHQLNKNNKDKVLAEAKERLQKICQENFFAIAEKLGKLDPYQYVRAYTCGLQEFVEAYSFYEYLSNEKLSDWTDLQQKLTYEVEDKPPAEEANLDNEPSTEVAEDKQVIASQPIKRTVACLVVPTDFILGLSDLTGEIMRRCVNSLGSGEIDVCFESCRCLQDFYKEYIGLRLVHNRELGRKITVLRQSMLKTENVCYNIKVRGSEAAHWGAMSEEKQDDLDEGFF